jgi:hypothetical protein
MAAILILDGSYSDPLQSRRSLRAAGYRMSEIVITLDDVRQLAAQAVVAEQMGEA